MLLTATLALWLVAYVAWTAGWVLQPMAFTVERALRRIPFCVGGVLLCWAMVRPLRAASGARFPARVLLACGLCAVAGMLQSGVGQVAYYLLAPKWGSSSLVDWLAGSRLGGENVTLRAGGLDRVVVMGVTNQIKCARTGIVAFLLKVEQSG